MDAFWKENEAYASGETPISHFLENGKPDHATDIIESMWGGLGKRFIVNTRNNGAVPNIQDDAILELRCDLDMGGVSPRPSGPMPLGIRGLTQQVLDTHELTAAAGATYDRDLLLRALATDPIVNNLGDARAVMEDLLEAEKDILRPEWYR
jgi:alpha-galactosidase